MEPQSGPGGLRVPSYKRGKGGSLDQSGGRASYWAGVTAVPMKSEADGEEPHSSQFHQR